MSLFFLSYPPPAVTVWSHRFSVIGDSALCLSPSLFLSLSQSLKHTHTHTTKKRRSAVVTEENERTLHILIVSLNVRVDFITQASKVSSFVRSETLKVLVDLFPPLLCLSGRTRGFGWACQDLSKFMLHRTSHNSRSQLESMISLE